MGGVTGNSAQVLVLLAACLTPYPTWDELDGDGDGWSGAEDCDDANPATYAGAEEICDGEDNDCDGDVDEKDEDHDGEKDVLCGGTDCDDADPHIHSRIFGGIDVIFIPDVGKAHLACVEFGEINVARARHRLSSVSSLNIGDSAPRAVGELLLHCRNNGEIKIMLWRFEVPILGIEKL